MAVELASLGLKVEYQDVEKAAKSLDNLAASGKKAEQSTVNLNRIANDNAAAMAKAATEIDHLARAQQILNANASQLPPIWRSIFQGAINASEGITRLNQRFQAFREELARFGAEFRRSFIAGLGLITGIEFGRMLGEWIRTIPEAAAAAQRLRTELTGLTGSAAGAEETLTRINAIIKQFGVGGEQAQRMFLRLAEATDGTRLAGERTVGIFKDLVTAWRALNLPAQDVREMFEAFARSAEDGRISIQDLTRIGRTAPGVLDAVAKASNMSRQELLDLARAGRLSGESIESFAIAIRNATAAQADFNSQSVNAAWERLSTAIANVHEQLGEVNPALSETQRLLVSTLNSITSWFTTGKVNELFEFFAETLHATVQEADRLFQIFSALGKIDLSHPIASFRELSNTLQTIKPVGFEQGAIQTRHPFRGESGRALGVVPGVTILPSQEAQNFQRNFASQMEQLNAERRAIQELTAASGRTPGSAVTVPGQAGGPLSPPFNEAAWKQALENYERVKLINQEIAKAKQAGVKPDMDAIEAAADLALANQKNLAIDKARAEILTQIAKDTEDSTRKIAQLTEQMKLIGDPKALGLERHKQAVDDIVEAYQKAAAAKDIVLKPEDLAQRRKAAEAQTSLNEQLQVIQQVESQILELKGEQADLQTKLTIGVDDYSQAMGEAAIEAERMIRQLTIMAELQGRTLDPAKVKELRDLVLGNAQLKFQQQQQEELQKPWLDAVEGLHQSFSGLWADILTEGKDAFSSLAKTIQSIFNQLVTSLISSFTKPLFDNLAASMTGAMQQAAAAGTVQGAAPTTAGSATAAQQAAMLAGGPGAAQRPGGFFTSISGMSSTQAGFLGGTMGMAGGALIGSAAFGQQPSLGGTLFGAGGALIGGVSGAMIGGPLGAFVGSAIGGAAGTLIGGALFGGGGEEKPPKTRGYGGLALGRAGQPIMNLTTVNELGRSAITDLLTQAKDVISGVLLTAGATQIQQFQAEAQYQGRTPRYSAQIGGRQYMGPQEPADPKAALDFFVRNYLQYGAQTGAFQGLGQSYQTVLRGLPAAAGVEDVTKRVSFAQLYDQLVDMGKPTSDFIKQIQDLHTQFVQARQQADEYGLSVDRLTEAYERARKTQISQFNRDIQTAILAITDPFQATMRTLDEQQAQRVRDARAVGADLTNVEKLNGLERQKVVEQFAQQTTMSLKAWAESLTTGPQSPLAPLEQFKAAQTGFQGLIGQAAGGSAAAFGAIPAAGNQLLTLARQIYGATPAFASLFEQVQSQAAGLSVTTAGVTGTGEEGPLTKKAWTESLQPINESFATLIDSTQQQTTLVTQAIETNTQQAATNTQTVVREVRLLRDQVAQTGGKSGGLGFGG